jgi:hypothetical protein
MSKMLESAIAKVRKLPKSLQDKAAERLMQYVDESPAASERVSIDEAREAYTNGDSVTLAKWRHENSSGAFLLSVNPLFGALQNAYCVH